MEQKSQLIDAIVEVAKYLEGTDILWIVGGSGSLFVHGLNVEPADIDIVADTNDYEKAVAAIRSLITGPTEPHGNTRKTPFLVGGFECELITFPLNVDDTVVVDFYGAKVRVFKLEVELGFYKSRTDKIEKNRAKIQMIEEALGKS